MPWGLARVDGQTVLNPAEVATIRFAYDLIVNRGQSCWQAAETLNQAGKPPRHAAEWNNRLLRGRLQSPTLKGEMFWSKPPSSARGRPPARGERNKTATGRYGDRIPVEIPAVLSETEWQALQVALDRTSLARSIHADQVYLLSGRGGARIETPCGGRMHGFYRADRDLRQYRCINARTEAGPKRCRCPRIDATELENLVRMHVLGLAMNPDLLTEQARRWLNPEPRVDVYPPEDLDARIERLERKRTNLALAAAELGPEAVVEAVGKVQAELDELVRRREEAQAQGNRQAQVEVAIPEILRYSQRLAEATFGKPDPHVWRRFLAQANVRVKIVRWLRPGEYSLMGDPYPFPYLASIEGELLAGDHATPGCARG